MIQNEEVEDPDAIISINADSQSFYVLNQGKEVIRTKEQKKEHDRKADEERERKRREKELTKQTIEIEQVEDLKDRLRKHMEEIRKLFGNKNNGLNPVGEEEDEDEYGNEEDGEGS